MFGTWFRHGIGRKRRFILEPLEERIVLDATVDTGAQDNSQDQPSEAGTCPNDSPEGEGDQGTTGGGGGGDSSAVSDSGDEPQAPGKDINVVLISNALGEIEALSQAVNDDAEVVIYNENDQNLSSIVQELTELTASRGADIGTLAVVSHGSPGSFDIGSDHVDLSTISVHESGLAALGELFSDRGQLQIYGCSVASGAEGEALLEQVAATASVTVYASVDESGGVRGDWNLEYSTNPSVAIDSLFVASWDGSLSDILDDGRVTNPDDWDAGEDPEPGPVTAGPPAGLHASPFTESGFEDKALIVDGWKFMDPDERQPDHVTIVTEPAYGRLFVDLDGNNQLNVGEFLGAGDTVSWADAGPHGDKVKFLGNYNWFGETTFSYSVTLDSATPVTTNTSTATVSLSPVIDKPDVQSADLPQDLEIDEGTYSTFSLVGYDLDGHDPAHVNFVLDDHVLWNGLSGEGEFTLHLSGGTLKEVGAITYDGDGKYTQEVKFSPDDGPASIDIECVLRTEKPGEFSQTGQSFGNAKTSGVNLADFDGDGDLDMLEANWSGKNVVRFNNGSGDFSGVPITYGESTETFNCAVGDIDGDGDVDIVDGNYYASTRVYLNNGDGSVFTLGQELTNHKTTFVELADIDNDGDLDLAEANFDQPNRIYLNDDGKFVDTGQELGNWKSYYVGFADVDDDGDLDLIVGTYVQNTGDRGTSVFLNNGHGTFTDTGQSLGSDQVYCAPLGDLDDDNVLEMYQATYQTNSRVWDNNGNGVFTNTGQGLAIGQTYTAALSDVDGDGDLDALEGNHGGYPDTLWLNDGNGFFSDSGQNIGLYKTFSIAVGDVNGDSWPDIVEGNDQEPNRVYFNTTTYDYSEAATFTITAVNVPPWISSNIDDVVTDEGKATAAIDLTDHITDVTADLPLSFTYDDGNGHSGTVDDPEHFILTYGNDGEYTVSIEADDGDGGKTQTTFKVTVSNQPPELVEEIADMATDEGVEIAAINLRDYFTDVAADLPLSFTYDDGNGHSGAVADPEHFALTYEDDGEYTVSVEADDGDGGRTPTTFTVTVSNVPPDLVASIADMTADEEVATTAINLRDYFTDVAADLPLSFTYDDGDGHSGVVGDPEHFTLTYGDDGEYTATVVADDGDGGQTPTTFTVTVSNVPPDLVASIADMTADEGVATTAINLRDYFSDVAADLPLSFTYDDGDGHSGVVGDPEHFTLTYGDEGEYTVSVEADDGDGGKTQTTFTVTVSNVPPDLAASIADMTADEGVETTAINLRNHFTDVTADLPLSFTYDDGDGHSGVVGDPEHFALTYGDEGEYTVSVEADDGDGGKTQTTFKVTVSNQPPELVEEFADMTTHEGVETTAINLRDHFTDVAADLPLSFTYDDGNGHSGAVADPENFTVVYGDNGVYDVTVTGRDPDGGATDVTFSVTVDNVDPHVTAEIPNMKTPVNKPTDPINLRDYFGDVAADMPLPGDGFTCDDGAGNVYQVLEPEHFSLAYADTGQYDVTITVRDKDGGSTVTTFTITVYSPPNSTNETVGFESYDPFLVDGGKDTSHPTTAPPFAAETIVSFLSGHQLLPFFSGGETGTENHAGFARHLSHALFDEYAQAREQSWGHLSFFVQERTRHAGSEAVLGLSEFLEWLREWQYTKEFQNAILSFNKLETTLMDWFTSHPNPNLVTPGNGDQMISGLVDLPKRHIQPTSLAFDLNEIHGADILTAGAVQGLFERVSELGDESAQQAAEVFDLDAISFFQLLVT